MATSVFFMGESRDSELQGSEGGGDKTAFPFKVEPIWGLGGKKLHLKILYTWNYCLCKGKKLGRTRKYKLCINNDLAENPGWKKEVWRRDLTNLDEKNHF